MVYGHCPYDVGSGRRAVLFSVHLVRSRSMPRLSRLATAAALALALGACAASPTAPTACPTEKPDSFKQAAAACTTNDWVDPRF